MPQQTLDTVSTRDMTCREMTLRNHSVIASDRSFEAVVATETLSQVFDMNRFDVIDEILVADGGLFPDSVVLLDNHQRMSGINSVMGSAMNFRREGNKWIGKGVVGKAVEGNIHREQLWQDLLDGHIRAVSIGYQVKNNDFVDIPPGQSQEVNGRTYTAGERTLRITAKWQVHELSLTPIGADSEALIRNQSRGQLRPERKEYFAR